MRWSSIPASAPCWRKIALVEDFPETGELPADAALPQALGLKRRRGLARFAVVRRVRMLIGRD